MQKTEKNIKLAEEKLSKQLDNCINLKDENNFIIDFLNKCDEFSREIESYEDYSLILKYFNAWEAYYKIKFKRYPDIRIKYYSKAERARAVSIRMRQIFSFFKLPFFPHLVC